MTPDYYILAVSAWQQANRSLKHFAECCYHVSDRQTQVLAQDCGCSVDTIENYRNAYTLYTELGGDTSEPARKLWEHSSIALWVKAAQLRIRLSLSTDKILDYLQTASENNMTREQFAAQVDNAENDTPMWLRRLRSAIKFLKPSRDDYKGADMPPEVRERYDKAVEWFVSELEQIAGEGVTE